MSIDLEKHPCFNKSEENSSGRIHLPVAPRCNIQCNYCNRKFDCMNENRPGVTSKVLSPKEALRYLTRALVQTPNIAVTGIAGPGDPFANAERTMATMRLVRECYPQMLLCVSTNGLGLLPWIDELEALQVGHVTITINAVDPEIGAEIYAWVRHGERMYHGVEAAALLMERQFEALAKLKERGIIAKVNCVVIPGVNNGHIAAIAGKVAEYGADVLNCIPYHQTPETLFENLPEPSHELMRRVRETAGELLPQMEHCARCRSDAAGLLCEGDGLDAMRDFLDSGGLAVAGDNVRPCIAVATGDGAVIDGHLAESEELWIYRLDARRGGVSFTDRRRMPSALNGRMRWPMMAELLDDCSILLASGAGEFSVNELGERGVSVVVRSGEIIPALRELLLPSASASHGGCVSVTTGRHECVTTSSRCA